MCALSTLFQIKGLIDLRLNLKAKSYKVAFINLFLISVSPPYVYACFFPTFGLFHQKSTFVPRVPNIFDEYHAIGTLYPFFPGHGIRHYPSGQLFILYLTVGLSGRTVLLVPRVYPRLELRQKCGHHGWPSEIPRIDLIWRSLLARYMQAHPRTQR